MLSRPLDYARIWNVLAGPRKHGTKRRQQMLSSFRGKALALNHFGSLPAAAASLGWSSTGAAERAVSRQNGWWNNYHLGETAHEDDFILSIAEQQHRTFSHSPSLQASAPGLECALYVAALELAGLDGDPADHGLDRGRLAGGTLRHGAGRLC